MPQQAQVFIHYGPYDICGIVDHKESRLQGLQTVLREDGHAVNLVPIKYWNVVEIWVNGEMVYKCDIRTLDYGGDGKLDDRCQEACQAVMDAY
ncbi:UPF0728 protein-like [Gigantopelta aegis]|uniref:UPF0728 protein-like n=1 Tax=Gigantopelta aegis TaxID=1735272 RepID=UPI001B88B2C4|nr:UPF0728 protein-like [Gigantopelta aegis]